jgi:hypothetical protein
MDDEPIIDGVDLEDATTSLDPRFSDNDDDGEEYVVEFDDTPNTEQELQAEVEENLSEQEEEVEEESEFPEELLKSAGMSEDYAAEHFNDASELAMYIRAMDRRDIELARQTQHMQQEPTQEIAEPEIEDVDLEKALEGFDDNTKNLIGAIDKKYKLELERRDAAAKKQREMFDNMIQQQQIAAQQQRIAEFDDFCNNLDGWEHVFGSGTIYTMDRTSPQFQNRAALERAAKLFEQSRATRGLPPVSREETLVRALYAGFGEEHEQIMRREIENQVVQRQKQHTTRPTSRQLTAPTNDREQMLQNIDKWWTDNGYNVPEYDHITDGI